MALVFANGVLIDTEPKSLPAPEQYSPAQGKHRISEPREFTRYERTHHTDDWRKMGRTRESIRSSR